MTTLTSLGLDPHAPLTLHISPKSREFLQALARLAQCTPADLATELLMEKLEQLGQQFHDILSQPDEPAQNPSILPQSPTDLLTAPDLVFEQRIQEELKNDRGAAADIHAPASTATSHGPADQSESSSDIAGDVSQPPHQK